MFDVFKISASIHVDTGNGWCKCGEQVSSCFYHRIYFPYIRASTQAALEAVFN